VLGALAAAPIVGFLFRQEHEGGCARLFHTEHYRCISKNCGYKRVKAGAVLIREGEEAEQAYVLERGELVIRKRDDYGTEKVLARLLPGDRVGGMSRLEGVLRSASVVAVRDFQLRRVT
jgi:CRP-like cAMP-binding protein